jgi:hypothetical protein
LEIVFILLILYGAGIKGKIVSALCHGVPQVVSDKAAEAMGLEHDLNVMIATDAAEFAEYIVTLYSDQTAWTRIADQGLLKAESSYSKVAMSSRISELLNE